MNCKVCNSDSNKLIQHKVYRCEDCGHTFINYTNDGIEFHKSLYRKPGHDGDRGGNEVKDGKFTPQFHKRREAICANRIKKIEHILPQCDTLLDIGAGGGTFLNMIKDIFKEVEATEVSDLCATNLVDYGYTTYHGAFNDLEIDRTYEMVTCWHVLEHIEDLEGFVEKATQVTEKYLIIEVPVNRKLRNPDRNFDGHFHYFSGKSLQLLFANDFDVEYIGDGVQMPCLLMILKKK